MKYMLLIYENQADREKMTQEQLTAEYQGYGAFEGEVAPIKTGGHALQPVTDATTVRVRSGKTLTTDGPFAETHEQLGGYYILDCKDLDEAIALAAKIPGAQTGSIEIRPVAVFE
jgi:hypothetical protein